MNNNERHFYIYIKLLLPVFLFLSLQVSYAGQKKEPRFEEMGREAARILADLIRLDTTNPPGNEFLVAEYLGNILDREGITYIRTATDEGRDNFIARYHGSGQEKPILLYSHSDVVPADVGWGSWTMDPFAGEVKDGVLYGRGAIDAKGLIVSHLAALILLKRNNIPLDRDVIFLVAAAEETGGGPGVAWLLEERPDLIDASVALGEGGRVWTDGNTIQSLWLQAAEKSAHNLKVTAIGEAGHAAIPSRKNAIEKLSRVLTRINQYRFEQNFNPVSETFISIMQPVDSRIQPGKPRYEAITRNTFAVTLVEGGIKTNVVPPFASANLNLRLLPGENLEQATRVLEEVAAEEGVTVRHKAGVQGGGSIIDFDTPFFNTVSEAAEKTWPGIVVAPYISPGTSDATKLRRAGIQAYGVMPFPLTPEENSSVHGADERIRLDALTDGIRFIYRILVSWAEVENGNSN